MDDMVLRAMAKWPDVPAVYGWLGLDRRGRWLLRGDPVANRAIEAFFGRNYACDDAGRWYVQNGPQRVYVELEYTPHVFRLDGYPDSPVLRTQGAVEAGSPRAAWLDEEGAVLIDSPAGVGVVDDRDLERLAPLLTHADGGALPEDTLAAALERLESGSPSGLALRWHGRCLPLQVVARSEVPRRFGFVQRPGERR